ncbi:MAG: ATP-binding protein [Clostridia bacterium]|nr:ATP-binding protein [Clostridia bacterium]
MICLWRVGAFIVDIGLRNYLLGFRDMDTGHIIPNIVYVELLRHSYDVTIGRVGDKEMDFIANSADERKYIHVTESMNDPKTRERELAPHRNEKADSFSKIVGLKCFPLS